MNIYEKSLVMHEKWQGKLEIISKSKVDSKESLSIAYTPGVAEPCRKIHENKSDVYKYTMKGNTVAIVTDGTAVLGLGDIGPEAALPVMEGKAVLFKEFANVNAFPICLDTTDVDEIVKTVTYLAPGFGGINLEDIAAPRCFEIEKKLKETLDIPVFHDDQHGTAIVTLAAIVNSLKLVGKTKESVKVVINGAGSAGIAIAKLLLSDGFNNVILCDTKGIICEGDDKLNWAKKEMAIVTNQSKLSGSLSDGMKGSDIFIGVSAPDVVTKDMVSSMNKGSIILAMSNPVPEIMPDLAFEGGASIVGTGRSDFPNQVNNVLAFPGIFKGVLEGRKPQITEEMKIASAYAIANMVTPANLSTTNILPAPFLPGIADAVADAVKNCQ
ncbi:MAG: NADP-dependent malic enzyme [Vallitaleaceae bacterium]|jgi:malate dehydrogenase (oxaloacetate-decarboxylating)|nr:NADP-dependent malic enzyme [Vallitaleaceae bacterium]